MLARYDVLCIWKRTNKLGLEILQDPATAPGVLIVVSGCSEIWNGECSYEALTVQKGLTEANGNNTPIRNSLLPSHRRHSIIVHQRLNA